MLDENPSSVFLSSQRLLLLDAEFCQQDALRRGFSLDFRLRNTFKAVALVSSLAQRLLISSTELKVPKAPAGIYTLLETKGRQCPRNVDSVVLVSSGFLIPQTPGSCTGKKFFLFLHGSISCSTSTYLTSTSSGKALGKDDFQACIWEVSREGKARQKSTVLHTGDECTGAWHQHSHSSSWAC